MADDSNVAYGERRLLIISCTRRKDRHPGLLSAWERYQGGCFPLLKQRQAAQELPADIDIFILSAKYGLLRPDELIVWYEQRMTPERAMELRAAVSKKMREYLAQRPYRKTCILLEPSYMECLRGFSFPSLTYLDGFLPHQLQALDTWLVTSQREEEAHVLLPFARMSEASIGCGPTGTMGDLLKARRDGEKIPEGGEGD